MDVELALKINRMVHNECKEVPHDIGLRIVELASNHQKVMKNVLLMFPLFAFEWEEGKGRTITVGWLKWTYSLKW